MFSNLILGLTVLSYIALLLFNLNRLEGTGDQLVGASFIGFFILVAYVVLSLVLTISVTANGGFNWVSNTILWRNVGVGVLWLGMIAGVVISAMIKADISFGDKLSGIERLFALLFYNGAIWLPLLMLLSYASVLNPEWRFALAPHLVKIPLLLGCAIGLITFATQNKLRPWIGSKTADYEINRTLYKIKDAKSVILPLYYINDKDKRLQDAALMSIKQQKHFEDEFLLIFEENLINSISSVFLFWKDNKIEHPERFIQAINNALPKITSELQEAIESPYKAGLPIDVEVMCLVLDQQFKDSSAVFRSNMLQFQEALAMNPAKREIGDSEEFNTRLNIYRLAVNNWLDTH